MHQLPEKLSGLQREIEDRFSGRLDNQKRQLEMKFKEQLETSRKLAVSGAVEEIQPHLKEVYTYIDEQLKPLFQKADDDTQSSAFSLLSLSDELKKQMHEQTRKFEDLYSDLAALRSDLEGVSESQAKLSERLPPLELGLDSLRTSIDQKMVPLQASISDLGRTQSENFASSKLLVVEVREALLKVEEDIAEKLSPIRESLRKTGLMEVKFFEELQKLRDDLGKDHQDLKDAHEAFVESCPGEMGRLAQGHVDDKLDKHCDFLTMKFAALEPRIQQNIEDKLSAINDSVTLAHGRADEHNEALGAHHNRLKETEALVQQAASESESFRAATLEELCRLREGLQMQESYNESVALRLHQKTSADVDRRFAKTLAYIRTDKDKDQAALESKQAVWSENMRQELKACEDQCQKHLQQLTQHCERAAAAGARAAWLEAFQQKPAPLAAATEDKDKDKAQPEGSLATASRHMYFDRTLGLQDVGPRVTELTGLRVELAEVRELLSHKHERLAERLEREVRELAIVTASSREDALQRVRALEVALDRQRVEFERMGRIFKDATEEFRNGTKENRADWEKTTRELFHELTALRCSTSTLAGGTLKALQLLGLLPETAQVRLPQSSLAKAASAAQSGEESATAVPKWLEVSLQQDPLTLLNDWSLAGRPLAEQLDRRWRSIVAGDQSTLGAASPSPPNLLELLHKKADLRDVMRFGLPRSGSLSAREGSSLPLRPQTTPRIGSLAPLNP